MVTCGSIGALFSASFSSWALSPSTCSFAALFCLPFSPRAVLSFPSSGIPFPPPCSAPLFVPLSVVLPASSYTSVSVSSSSSSLFGTWSVRLYLLRKRRSASSKSDAVIRFLPSTKARISLREKLLVTLYLLRFKQVFPDTLS